MYSITNNKKSLQYTKTRIEDFFLLENIVNK